MGDFWLESLRLLDKNGFVPTESLEKLAATDASKRGPQDKLTLFEIVRLASGVDWSHREWSDLSFWDWPDLRSSWKKVWEALDESVHGIGAGSQRAVVWAFNKNRTQEEIRVLLAICADNFHNIDVPRPEPRPEARLMVGQGKTPAALANTYAVLRQGTNLAYGDLLSASIRDTGSDEDLLAKLDLLVESTGIDRSIAEDQSLIPRLLVRAKSEEEKTGETGPSTFIAFIERMDEISNFEGVSDFALQRRLAQMAPEKNASARKILETSLHQ